MLIKSLEFRDYKSFSHFSISAKRKNVLVGPNNIGKSTALDAFRIAFDALRYCQRRKAIFKTQENGDVCSTYLVPHSVVQSDLRYCVHNFADGYAKLSLKADNGSAFNLKITPDADIECYLQSDSQPRKNSNFLLEQFPINIVVIPTLSPLEENEELVKQETVERNRYGRLASRNFRNFWLHRTDAEFEEFADLVEFGWPGIRIRPPEVDRSGQKPVVRMYFRDGPHVREVQWAGFGFQVWMQTMMHLYQADHQSILILDEPDIYLHPDLQHRLLRLIAQRVGQFFIATHSTELINDVDPGDVLILRPNSRSAKRIRTEGDYAQVFDAIGSSENAQFARLARTKKVIYFEGNDNRLLSKIAKKFGDIDYLSNSSVTIMKTDGFSNWTRVSTTAWVLNSFFEFDVKVAALFDRDYRSDDEVEEFVDKMKSVEVNCHVLPVKEIENILLSLDAIKKAVEKHTTNELDINWKHHVEAILDDAIEGARDTVLSRKIGQTIEYQLSKNPKKNTTTISAEVAKEFSVLWKDADYRRSVVSGKKVFSEISKNIQEKYGVTITGSRVIDELDISEVPIEVFDIMSNIKKYFEE